MKNWIIRTLLTALLILVIAYFLPNIIINGMISVIIFAVVLSLLNTFVKPILKVLTFPITVLTLGLFLIVVNAIVIAIADYLVDDFEIVGTVTLFLFTILLSIGSYIIGKIIK